MSLKFPCLLLLVLLTSCLDDDGPQKIDKWYVDSWEATGGCFFIENDPEENEIFETLLGLEDSTMTETELLLRSDGEMQILKNNVVALSGRWNNSDRHVLALTANDQFWNFEVVSRNEDSILLREENYQYVYQVDIVLKRR